MGVMEPLLVPYDGWTVDDMPELDAHCELVDGGLLMTPPATPRHQEVAQSLSRVLEPALPSAWRATAPQGLWFDDRNYRIPDLLVYDRAASARGRIVPQDALLVVEVMSPGSVSTDRVAKPAQYAAAGIPHFWRVELEPLSLVVHRLSKAAYEVVGQFDDAVVVTEPVELAFRLSALLD